MNNGFFDRFGGFQNFLGQFQQFQKNFNAGGMSPQQKVQELLNSGQMSQEQFNQFRQLAMTINGGKL